ncbi:hypothetical protein COLO4_04218 [Corchorus olitorius]|uniref:Tyrosine-protein kinase catalytic domain-containing protein n=1 Tax=Corchorus olitorius TaxID=93759 RepID=A0A1R3KUS9_9ROSI|nr:hypothetical protein COLO4_04218 [Corchorus olitorius]
MAPRLGCKGLLHTLVCSLLSALSICLVDDISCLKSIKDSLDDPHDHLKNWNFNNDTEGFICHFAGIECWHSDENKVLNIRLGNMGLKGQFPEGIKKCQSLTLLDLSNNELSGPIPSNISHIFRYGTSLDLSFNKFSGSVPDFGDVGNTLNDERSYVGNPWLCGFPDQRNKLLRQFISTWILNRRIKNREDSHQTGKLLHLQDLLHENSRETSMLVNLVSRMSYSDLDEATNNFSADNIIGFGQMGTTYKATLPNGWLLAIKRLSNIQTFDEHFITELKTVGRLRHDNLVPLLGFCIESKEKLLNFEPKISNFGEAMLMKSNQIDWSSSFYVDSEFWELSFVKEDVYRFGILLLELITGDDPSKLVESSNAGDDQSLCKWVFDISEKADFYDIVDKSLIGRGFDLEIFQIFRVACDCVQPNSDTRPTMLEVLKAIRTIGKRHDIKTSSEVTKSTASECSELLK